MEEWKSKTPQTFRICQICFKNLADFHCFKCHWRLNQLCITCHYAFHIKRDEQDLKELNQHRVERINYNLELKCGVCRDFIHYGNPYVGCKDCGDFFCPQHMNLMHVGPFKEHKRFGLSIWASEELHHALEAAVKAKQGIDTTLEPTYTIYTKEELKQIHGYHVVGDFAIQSRHYKKFALCDDTTVILPKEVLAECQPIDKRSSPVERYFQQTCLSSEIQVWLSKNPNYGKSKQLSEQ